MIDKQFIHSTGVYWNANQHQHEAWVVDQDTGEKKCIGWIAEDASKEDPYRRWWEQRAWWQFLGLPSNNSNNAPTEQQARTDHESAKQLGISMQELYRRKYLLRVAWEGGGGIEAARARLKFAEDYLQRHDHNGK